MNLDEFEICLIHGEQIIYIDKEQSDSTKQSLCIQCVAEQNRNLKMIDNIKSRLSNSKEQLIQNREFQTKQNIDLLTDLLNVLHQQQGKLCFQIEKCQQNINSQINLLERSNLQYKEKIEKITVHDLYRSDKIKSQIKQEIIDCKGVKDNLMKQMNTLEIFQIKQLYEERIQKIDFGDQNFELEQLWDLELGNNKKELQLLASWKCDEHQENIIYIDIGDQQTTPNRLACRKCVPQYNIKCNNIEDLQLFWEKYKKETHQITQKYLQFQQKIDNKIINIIKEFKIEINQEIDRLIQLIQESIQFNCNDSQYKPFTLLEKEWQSMSKEEIMIIANTFVQRNFAQNNIKQNLRNDFRYKKELLKNSIISNFQKMQIKTNGLVLQISDNITQENTPNLNIKPFQIRRGKNYSFLVPLTNRNEKLLTENSPLSRREFDFESYHDSLEIEYLDQDSPQMQKPTKMQYQLKSKFRKIQQYSYQYELLKEFDENSPTFTIAINQQSSILAFGQYYGELKIFSFKNGSIKLIQILKEHTLNVKCLYFMKRSQSFLSGSNDQSIIIWNEDFDNKFYSSQKLIGHQGQVLCLIMNNQENLIISGSRDKTIRFWVKEIEWKCHQILNAHQNSVRSISLNSFQNQLISCAEEELKIVVSQLQQDYKTWAVVNEIKVDYSGSSLLFINENMFAFQPTQIDQLQLYKQQSQQKNQYVCKQQIKIKTQEDCTALFPITYIKSKSILMTKNSRFINIIQKDRNDVYVTEQSFENSSNCCAIHGTLTSDGEFLIMWDGNAKKIIVRQLKDY